MKTNVTFGELPGLNERIEATAKTIKIFKMIEDRFNEALLTCPIPELDEMPEGDMVFLVTFRKEVPE
jgi:hypothetical protein